MKYEVDVKVVRTAVVTLTPSVEELKYLRHVLGARTERDDLNDGFDIEMHEGFYAAIRNATVEAVGDPK
jgi:hypothetical protein